MSPSCHTDCGHRSTPGSCNDWPWTAAQSVCPCDSVKHGSSLWASQDVARVCKFAQSELCLFVLCLFMEASFAAAFYRGHQENPTLCKGQVETGEIAQLGKCSPYNHEDLCLIFGTSVKEKPDGVVAYKYNPDPGEAEKGRQIPGSHWPAGQG